MEASQYQKESAIEVVCVGETMLMFAPQRYELIESSEFFRTYNGGAESNVAIGLERLGVHTSWISKVPNNALGRRIVNEIRGYGVDTSRVIWTAEGRIGLFFVEFGAQPRPSNTIYDRANSAFSTFKAEELDWQFISQAKVLHLTGITPALSETCRQTTIEIVKRAQALGLPVSFDVNYRAMLWEKERARKTFDEILPHVNIIIATQSDAILLLGKEGNPREMLRELKAKYSSDIVVLTLSSEGSMAFDGDEFYKGKAYALEEQVNRLGAGDAFDAGLLYGYLKSDLQTGLFYGGAMAALKHTVPQNIPILNKRDIERLIFGQKTDILR
ncbi:TPA: sugar kinase [Candidatus Poribacteria bacterium]|nr:sugar kinase [Candidatus Poribacteria bacterium]